MQLNNYYPDLNRFNLAGPPQWFLRKLMEFDPSLVIVPSRQGFMYRLGQRRKLQLSENVVNDVLKEQADTLMLASYGLVPVTTIVATANWSNPYIFVELANRAPWRLGGADKVNAMLEAQDSQDEFGKRAQTDEHLTYLSKDAWKYYRTKIGLGRSWNLTPETTKSQSKPLVKALPRQSYYPGFSGGL